MNCVDSRRVRTRCRVFARSPQWRNYNIMPRRRKSPCTAVVSPTAIRRLFDPGGGSGYKPGGGREQPKFFLYRIRSCSIGNRHRCSPHLDSPSFRPDTVTSRVFERRLSSVRPYLLPVRNNSCSRWKVCLGNCFAKEKNRTPYTLTHTRPYRFDLVLWRDARDDNTWCSANNLSRVHFTRSRSCAVDITAIKRSTV